MRIKRGPNTTGLPSLVQKFPCELSVFIFRTKISYRIRVFSKTKYMIPNSMGMRGSIAQFIWPSSNSIIRPWISCSTRVLTKTNQTSLHSMVKFSSSYCHFLTSYLDQLHDGVAKEKPKALVIGRRKQCAPSCAGPRALTAQPIICCTRM
ncbi:hypothetical protein EVAR_30015_1 [Eumeta japonica]|uniref:Uncharacterized protein n=1 Tax=Eumeta variegata TaxID=151549 RepID=A0A4C1VVG1_EUMVA|nr:hypothetical protein EVAR_30015_1 [Eumeta japonica]